MFDVNSVSIYQLYYDFYRVIVDENTRRIDRARTENLWQQSCVHSFFWLSYFWSEGFIPLFVSNAESIFEFSNSDNAFFSMQIERALGSNTVVSEISFS